jgi:hypothetical protein
MTPEGGMKKMGTLDPLAIRKPKGERAEKKLNRLPAPPTLQILPFIDTNGQVHGMKN